jgi:epoxyqueuosine reductase QueG
MNKILSEDVKFWARKLGAKLVGIASADSFKGAPEGFHPKDMLSDATSVVVIATPLLYGVVEKATPFKAYETYIPPHIWKHGMPSREYASQYVSVNAWLDRTVQELGYMLEERGFYALAVPASSPFAGMGMELSMGANITTEQRIELSEKYKWGDISQRHAAVLAGLGELGLNNLLLTPEYGPRVRIGSIITDAPLVADKPFSEVLCPGKQNPGKCNLCIKSCPYGALPESKEALLNPLDYNKVDKFRCLVESGKDLKTVLGTWTHAICAICMKACPIGKKLPTKL